MGRLRFIPLFCLMAMGFSLGADSDDLGAKAKVEGFVIEVSNSLLTVEDKRGTLHAVIVDSQTHFKERKSNFLREPVTFDRSDLLAGLKIVAKGRLDGQGRLLASKIKFSQHDLRVAEAVHSRVRGVEGRLDATTRKTEQLANSYEELTEVDRTLRGDLRDLEGRTGKALESAGQAHTRIDRAELRLGNVEGRLQNLDQYDIAHRVTVYFKADAHQLSGDAVAELDRLAAAISATRGALVEVTGHASADGSEVYNRRLSQRRAQSVIQYLAEEKLIPLRLFVNPHGFGELLPAAENSTPEGRRQNRRAEIRVLVSRALGSPAATSAP